MRLSELLRYFDGIRKANEIPPRHYEALILDIEKLENERDALLTEINNCDDDCHELAKSQRQLNETE